MTALLAVVVAFWVGFAMMLVSMLLLLVLLPNDKGFSIPGKRT